MKDHHSSEPRLLERLKAYAATDALPMHMPGHKRNSAALSLPDPVSIDITEIDGFDNLHAAGDLLLACQNRAARVFGAEETHFLVNGSTGGILAAFAACAPRGGSVLMARNAHKSALNAVCLNGLTPVYLYPSFLPASGISGAVSPELAAAALDAHPEIRCAFVTSPTYEGVLSDIHALSRVCHERGVILIVDEAHGAHLGFGGFPPGAIRLGADIAVQSVHKTLGSLTQTALLHVSGPLVDRPRLRRMLSVYQTSSPSYVLMASIDECALRMEREGDALAARWLANVEAFRRKTRLWQRLRLLPVEDVPADPSKINVSCHGTDIDGPRLAALLRGRGIEPEMVSSHYVVAMTGFGDTAETLRRLADALGEIDASLSGVPAAPPVDPLTPRPVFVMTPAEADLLPSEPVPVEEAANRVCAEAVFAYPPGIPLMVPGEAVNAGLLRRLLSDRAMGVLLHSDSGGLPRTVRCLKPLSTAR